jgi:hypothetical protein
LSINANVEVELEEYIVRRESTQDIFPDFVGGWAFGNAIGVGIRSVSGWWDATGIALSHPVDVGKKFDAS